MKPSLGELKRLDLRSVFPDEAADFTPWLAEPENLARLADKLGLELEFEGIEVKIGSFEADILARDVATEDKVIIENQIEKTNHDHLGKIITYAAGMGAKTVVWVAKEITSEHKQALQWLNEVCNQEINFFGVEIVISQIDDSKPAVDFDVVCSPNEWSKAVKARTQAASVESATKQLQLEFWNTLKQHMTEQQTFLRLRNPRPQHWYNIAVGRSKFSIALTVNTTERRVGCEIFIRGPEAKKAFRLLERQKPEIERELNSQLEWKYLEDRIASRIIQYEKGDIRDREEWPRLLAWCQEHAEAFHQTFSKRIKELELEEEPVGA